MFDLNLKDKVILITGGSDGLGFSSAKLLSEQGAKIALCGRRGDYLKEKADIIREETKNDVLDIQCDVTNADQCKKLVEQTISHFKEIDVLVNNAGTSVTRAAGINLTKSLSNEFAPFNIRVNAICIGLIKSAQWERRAGNSDVNQLYDEMSKRVPMGKVGEEIDYANLVAFLSSDRSAYITGTAINVDGGLCPVV